MLLVLAFFAAPPPRRRVCLAKATVFAGLAQALSSNRQLQFGVRTRIIWSYSKGAAIKFAALFCLSAQGWAQRKEYRIMAATVMEIYGSKVFNDKYIEAMMFDEWEDVLDG